MADKGRYLVLKGLSYRPLDSKEEVRHEPGEIIDDLLPKSIPSLLEQEAIEPITGRADSKENKARIAQVEKAYRAAAKTVDPYSGVAPEEVAAQTLNQEEAE